MCDTLQDAVNQLKNIATASPAVKLFAEWCEKCTEDPAWRGRFKVCTLLLLPINGTLYNACQ